MKTLTVIRQLNGYSAPVVSYQECLDTAVHFTDKEVEHQATLKAREHLQAFTRKFPEFRSTSCKWWAYVVDNAQQSTELGCHSSDLLPLAI